ncbi:MAG: hypothetical protein ABI947_28330 [Chloroflexota bacterium]
MPENAFLRQQLIVLKRQVRQPNPTATDRGQLVALAKRVRDWKNALLIVKPESGTGRVSSASGGINRKVKRVSRGFRKPPLR